MVDPSTIMSLAPAVPVVVAVTADAGDGRALLIMPFIPGCCVVITEVGKEEAAAAADDMNCRVGYSE